MQALLGWVARTDDHPLIASSLFHYEFAFIHPFADGNGRLGRLWQTLILRQWRALFADLPVETLVHAHQSAYYDAIAASTAAGSATPFVEFMLAMIRAALAQSADASGSADGVAESFPLTEQVPEQATEQVARLLDALGSDICSSRELMTRLGLRHRPTFLYDYLRPALSQGLVERSAPDHPRSPRQRYRRGGGPRLSGAGA